MNDLSLFASVPRGLESLLAGELRGLGADHVRQVRAGVSFAGSLETAYRACLWSRVAGRVLLPLASGPAADGDELYATAGGIDWSDHLGADVTLAVDFSGVNQRIRDTRYGAVRIKDAIVDQLREATGRRPSVDPRAPGVRVNAHLASTRVTVSIDLSGQSLHRRGYRAEKVQVEAPLKENLAAGILLYASWPRDAAAGGSLLDPLCGSGTLPIEAALIAADVAPGLLRAEGDAGLNAGTPAFGFLRWRGHDAALWADLIDEARQRRNSGTKRLAAARPDTVIRGSDRDARAVKMARDCVARAGLHGLVVVEQAGLETTAAPAAHGLLATNAPYGERLAAGEDPEAVYRLLGERLRTAFGGWAAAVLAGDRRQIAALGLAVKRDTDLRNGPLTCVLAYLEPGAARPADAPRSARAAVRSAPPALAKPGPEAAEADRATPRGGSLGGGAEYLANRLRKNQRRLARRLQREGITCYRLYDADLPEYNLVVDVYGDRIHIQEYAAPPEVDPEKAQRRLAEALDVIGAVMDAPPENMVLRQRRRQRGSAQYERRAGGAPFTVTEDDLSYLVDLGPYVDTGFFIDQRLTRRLVRRLAGGRRFVNLFSYTGTMTVNALAGGSPASTTVDLSATYLDWAARNLAANGFTAAREQWPPDGERADRRDRRERTAAGSPHTLMHADCLRWIVEADGEYDLVWLDPPTFSNSKRMGRATFDVQRDHADLIRLTARRLLAPGGILLFATNRRGFRLDLPALAGLDVKDLSKATLAFDCERGASRHHVFRIERGAG
jgi:23S rRNA (guanine2445-N2)-methyltransferase / 23S rRNA (guanine2069-N7)-methyltransferase